jgi:hypothetical protein
VAVAAGGAAVALGVAVLLANIVHLRATAGARAGSAWPARELDGRTAVGIGCG